MVRVECVATQGFLTFISMPLLTELISIKEGFSYKHGVPNGAVSTRQYRSPLETAENPNLPPASAVSPAPYTTLLGTPPDLLQIACAAGGVAAAGIARAGTVASHYVAFS